jgi:cob(I)alamin adenosyltransferase
LEAVKRHQDEIDFHVMGNGFTWKSKDFESDKSLALKAWDLAKEAMFSKTYHLVVLDEFTHILRLQMLDLPIVLETLAKKPIDLHVAITGRAAPQELIDIADLVTEMKAVKHHLKSGIKAQKGIEF